MRRIVGVLVAGVLAACGPEASSAAPFVHRTIIPAPNDAGSDFATGVALSSDGKTLAIATSYVGLAYVYVLNGASWELQTVLSVDAKWGGFGRDLALSENGSVLAVTANFEALDGGNASDGAVYVFERTGSTWSQLAHITNPGPVTQSDYFGRFISLNNAGTELAISREGAVHLYERNNDDWVPQAIVPARSGPWLSGDGQTLLLGGSTPVNLDDGGTTLRGTALLFNKDGGVWTQSSAIDFPGTNLFGSDFALTRDASTFALSAVNTDSTVGVAYVYGHNGAEWALQRELTTVATPDGYFGALLAMNDDASRVAVSMPSASSPSDAGWVGGIWVYTRAGADWTLQRLDPDDDTPREFGRNMSMSGDGDTLAVGVPPLDSFGVQGHVDVFTTW